MKTLSTLLLAGCAAIAAATAFAADDAKPIPFAAPRDADILKAPNADAILYGRLLTTDTRRLLPDNVGNAMNCTSCHLGEAKVPDGGSFVGTAKLFPQDNPRAGRIFTLADRINGCFMRSMNGKPLAGDSKEMQAMLAYMDWLSTALPADLGKRKIAGRGAGKINMKLVPDPEHGKAVYAEKCAVCHGANGEGLKDGHGEYVFPPLWGDESFNIGAGMARTYKAAAFVLYNMPVGHGLNSLLGQGGALSEQDAVDVSEYFTHQPRPDFAGKVNDWPNGGKPKDARY